MVRCTKIQSDVGDWSVVWGLRLLDRVAQRFPLCPCTNAIMHARHVTPVHQSARRSSRAIMDIIHVDDKIDTR